jgi:hypothetical protein
MVEEVRVVEDMKTSSSNPDSRTCPTERSIELILQKSIPVLTVVQIGTDKFVNGHHKGRQENVDKRIVEETL